jgi:SPP1 family predicted phage head-tail adaptor
MSITTNSRTQFKGGLALKLKDKKIEILAVTHTQDPDGFPIKTLTPIAPPMWAYFRQLSGKEVYAAMSVQATEEVQFVVNWCNDITTAHVIHFRSVDYDITRVDTFEGYKQDLTLYCKKRA